MSASVVIFTSVAAVAALRWALAPIVGERLPFVLWMFAIIVSALRGGALAGSAATLLSALAAVVLFEPVGTLRIDSREDVMALLIFILVGVTTSVFLGRLRSERMRAAAASVDLTRSEERFRALIERGSDVLTISDREGRITFASPSVETVCGYSVEEFQSTHPFERIHPDDVPRCRAAFEDLVRHPGRSITLEHRYCHGDGSWHWLEGTFTSLFHDPAIEGLVANFRDVTERKKVELRESLLARVSETLASTLDYQTTLMQTANLLVVGGFADWCLVDLRVEDGALERVAASHADPERAEDVEALRTQFGPAQRRQVEIERVIETGEPIMRAEIPADMRERVGSDEVFSAVVERLGLSSYIIAPLTARGTVFGALSIIASGRAFDETDLDLASEFGRRAGYTIENARLYREAHAANQSKDDFLAVLSHELRTPLTSILGWASMLRMETVDPETTRAGIVAIEQSARAQARLVDDLLDVSRIVTGRLRLDQTRIDLGVVARETAEMLRSTAEEKGLHLRVNLPPSQAMVRGDWGRLRQVIGNILANAAKFTAAGGTVSLDLATQDKRAVLTVTDTGEGITAEFLPHVFERFRQADPNSAKYGGMGLGLAIAKQLVELHGGTITVSSDGRGHGAAFRVSIPLVTATDGTPMIGG